MKKHYWHTLYSNTVVESTYISIQHFCIAVKGSIVPRVNFVVCRIWFWKFLCRTWKGNIMRQNIICMSVQCTDTEHHKHSRMASFRTLLMRLDQRFFRSWLKCTASIFPSWNNHGTNILTNLLSIKMTCVLCVCACAVYLLKVNL